MQTRFGPPKNDGTPLVEGADVRRLILPVLVLIGLGAVALREWTGSEGVSRAPTEVPALGPITIAATGDTLLHAALPRNLGDDQETAPILDLIAGATPALTNLEMQLLDEVEAGKASSAPRSSQWPFGVRETARSPGWAPPSRSAIARS